MNFRLHDVKIPADASDQQTTDARSAVPPAEFNVARIGLSNQITITDRQGVQNRAATASYRIYFLPAEYAPFSIGNTTTASAPVVYNTAIRKAGRQVANLVADIAAPALGTDLQYLDTMNVGKAGFYFCTAVNRAGVEAPPEHMVSSESIADQTTSGGGVT